jgi:hypothetical protein
MVLSDAEDGWDEALAARLPGRLVLVGLTYLDVSGEPVEQTQFFGRVQSAEAGRGILLRLEGARAGEACNLPPDTRAFREAEPGEYRLRSTGETIVDPDFIAQWTINPPGNEHSG